MMRNFCLCVLFSFFILKLSSQEVRTLEEVRLIQTEKIAQIADLQSQIDAIQGEVDLFQDEIDNIAGWRKGLSGLLGFSINRSRGWVANPNPRATTTALSIGLTAFANYGKDKFFWHNKGILSESWQDVDKNEVERQANNDGLFDNGVVDLLNVSSLAGYKISETFALSGLAEVNTSIANFLSPGTLDVGLGATWIPSKHLTVTILPINYHVAFSGINNLDNASSIGGKVRIDYFKDFRVYGSDLTWTSTFTTFVPYQNKSQFVYFDPTIDPLPAQSANTGFTSGLFEYTWLNTISLDIWRGLGVGIGWGLRKSEFEGEKFSESDLETLNCEDCLISGPSLQRYFNFGLSYGF